MSDESCVWGVVPVKALAAAKMRLASVLSAAQRLALARAMLCDVLDALAACPSLGGIIVITPDAEAARIAHEFHARVLPEEGSGLNAAVTSAAGFIRHELGGAMLVVPGDVPHIATPVADAAAAALTTAGRAVLARAERDGGTNLFGCNPAPALQPSFGPNSYARHAAFAEHASLHPTLLNDFALGLDLDEPADLHAFLALDVQTRTHALLRSWNIKAFLPSSAGSAKAPALTLPLVGRADAKRRGGGRSDVAEPPPPPTPPHKGEGSSLQRIWVRP